MTQGEFLRWQAANLQGEVTVAWLSAQAGSGVPGLVLVLTALPSVLPLPGVGNITGSALVLMAWAIWRGQEALWMPARLAALRVPTLHAGRLLRLLAWLHDQAARHLHPRASQCVGPRSWNWTALPVALMGVVIFLPIPLGNVLGAVAVASLGLGHSLDDGLAVVLGWVLTVLTLLYSLGVTWGLTTFGQALWVGVKAYLGG